MNNEQILSRVAICHNTKQTIAHYFYGSQSELESALAAVYGPVVTMIGVNKTEYYSDKNNAPGHRTTVAVYNASSDRHVIFLPVEFHTTL